eukprot:m.642608 g.642608  ORF g.642608 m.642608 type:complete len:225 (+) comp22640_c0_seq1:1872-2546(+)
MSSCHRVRLRCVAQGLAWGPGGTGGGYRKGLWNGLRVDSGRALIVNGTRLYATKGIGNGTMIPSHNPSGMYQALQGVFFPNNNSRWDSFPWHPYDANPVTRANNNTYTVGGAENCEFMSSPLDKRFHAVCAAHGAAYPNGNYPHYVVTVTKPEQESPRVTWTFVGFVSRGYASGEPTPVYENAPPGDAADVRFMIGRTQEGIALYEVSWVTQTGGENALRTLQH